MTLLSGIVSSSGTDVPLEDWVFLGADTTVSGVGMTFDIPIGNTNGYMGIYFIADLYMGPATVMGLLFNDVLATASYRIDSVTNGGSTTSTFIAGSNLFIPVTFGRNVVTGTYYANSISEPENFVIKSMRQNQFGWGMSTLAGQFDTGFNPNSFGISSEWDAGSRLSVWGIPRGFDI